MTPTEIYMARVAQYGTTEDANTPKALAAKQMSEEMRVILGQRNLVLTRSKNLVEGMARRRQKSQISYQGVSDGK